MPVIVIVVISTKIAVSRDLGTWATRKHNDSIEKLALISVLQIEGYISGALQIEPFFFAIIAMPIDSAYSMHNAMYFLLMHTILYQLVKIVEMF